MQFFIKWFGVSDALDRPDASTLAARAAGHWSVGAGSSLFVWALGAAIGVASLLLALLYGAWEVWQWWVDPEKFQRRVARRWDGIVDWLAVQMGGICISLTLTLGGWPVALAVTLSVALILISAAIMSRPR